MMPQIPLLQVHKPVFFNTTDNVIDGRALAVAMAMTKIVAFS